MTYTCAFWENVATLDAAQENKLDLTCRKLQPGMHVLDIKITITIAESKNTTPHFSACGNIYLLSCAGSFHARKSQLWQIVLSKNGISGGYKFK